LDVFVDVELNVVLINSELYLAIKRIFKFQKILLPPNVPKVVVVHVKIVKKY